MALLDPLRNAVTSLDPELLLRDTMTAPQSMQFITSQMDLCENLLSAFAVLGLLLATLGIYGAIARLVAQRTPEIGVRIALGAQLSDIARLVLGSGVRIAVFGSILGILGAAALARSITAFLPRLQGEPVWVLPITTVLLISVAIAACLLPTHRAIRINPLEALRDE